MRKELRSFLVTLRIKISWLLTCLIVEFHFVKLLLFNSPLVSVFVPFFLCFCFRAFAFVLPAPWTTLFHFFFFSFFPFFWWSLQHLHIRWLSLVFPSSWNVFPLDIYVHVLTLFRSLSSNVIFWEKIFLSKIALPSQTFFYHTLSPFHVVFNIAHLILPNVSFCVCLLSPTLKGRNSFASFTFLSLASRTPIVRGEVF